MTDSELLEQPIKLTAAWPPPYAIRVSHRARRVTLNITVKQGLEIIVPKHRIRKPNIERLLTEKRSWIERHLPLYLELQAIQRAAFKEKPLLLDLRAIQKVYTLSYFKTEHKFVKIKKHPNLQDGYVIVGAIEDDALVFAKLRHFLKVIAKKTLIPMLERASLETNLQFSTAIIRSQSTLWGSCNSKKKISLNSKLLFMPEHLVRYILLHELSHIKYLNHSANFWSLLKSFDPNCLQHRREMKGAAQYVPGWMET